MKANVLYDIGDIRFTEVQDPEPIADEVLIRVFCAGICGSDIPRIYQTGAHVMPLIPGHEFSGVVEKIGAHVDNMWIGKRVGVFPLIPCGKCGPCRQKRYELCRHYNYLGSRCDGGFAELVRVPAANLIEIPNSVSMEAAAMLEPMSVAMHAIRRTIPDFGTEGFTSDPSIRIAVIGLGTIGLLLTSLLCSAGYQQILVSGKKDYQRDIAQRLGIPKENIYPAASDKQQCPIFFSSGKDNVKRITAYGYTQGNISGVDSDCPVNDEDNSLQRWILDRTDGQGADIVFECVGKNETAVQAIDAAAPLGRVVFVGNPAGNMQFPRDVYWKILRNQLTVIGTWNSSFTGEENDDWHCVRRLLKEERVKPEALITQRLPMEKLEQGLRIMRNKTEEYVKVMVVNHTSEMERV
ncbi:galactitol-1-phosphate 5-dehydrogenase [Lachnospiraceae bacterium YH-ros2228]